MTDIIRPQVDCSSAQDFLSALSPIGPYFSNPQYAGNWLFRGQGKDDPLIPSAFRTVSNSGVDKLAELRGRTITTHGERRLAEWDVLIQFFDIADKRGLVLPDDSQQLRSMIETLNSDRGRYFLETGDARWSVQDVTLSLLALAQHYGIPTRLLDWTRLPFVAAFFAAEGVWNHRQGGGKPLGCLVVWAFSSHKMGKHDMASTSGDPVRIVTAPSATNPNLKAQQGVFSLLHYHYTEEFNGSYKSLEQILTEYNNHQSDDQYSLQKFTLPVSEADELINLLAKLDITPSAIYPGYQTIIRDLEMQKP